MNICMLTGTFHPKIGGAETYARTIADGMCKAGHDVIVLTDGVGLNCPRYEQMGDIQVLRASNYISMLDDPDKVRWQEMYFGLLDELCTLLGDRKLDVLHANSLHCAILGSMLALTLHIPLVCSFHEQEPENLPFGEGKCKLVFSYIPVEMFLAGGKFFFLKAQTYGAEEERLRLIYHGVDLKKFYPHIKVGMRSALGVSQEDFFILCVGRLKQRKGLLELVRALRIVKDVIPNIHLLIAGSCNSASRAYADIIHQEINDLGLVDTVGINESLTLDDMPDIYSAADLVVQPSHAEGLMLTILEAMASGKPVIGTTILGIQEIITHEVDGLLVPPKTIEPLAEAIVRLATNSDIAQKLAMAGLTRVRSHFNIERTIQETESAYLELIQRDQKTRVEH